MLKKRPKKQAKSVRKARNSYFRTRPDAVVPEDLRSEVRQLLAVLKGKTDKKRAEKKARKPVHFFTVDEIRRFFAVLKGNRDKAMFRLIYLKALRASEVGMLRMEDYHEREGRLYVRRLKNSKGGEFRLHRQEAQFLRAWVRERGRSPGAIFRSRNHRPISRRQLDRLVKEYGAAAGISPEKCHVHAFKHSRGTHLLADTRDITLVQDQLGHRNIQNTMIYAEVSNAARDDLFEKQRDRW
jgi:site-specific recombinase XerD